MEREASAVEDSTLTATLTENISALEFEHLPPDAVALAEQCFVDTVGVMLAGAQEGAGATAVRMANAALNTGGPATIIGDGATTAVTDAAFVNGVAAHGLDFDDVAEATLGHPSVTMVPPILALAEAREAPGSDAITAYVAGFETQCFIGSFVETTHSKAGWHATATIGAFGAAGATANMLDLDVERTRHALNIAASTPAGLSANFGAMTKPMHAGQAARSGLTSALLAAEGFTAAPEAIGGDGGFLDVYAASDNLSPPPSRAFDTRWGILEDGIHFKKYPCCYFTHTAITATSTLVNENDIAPEDIERVHVTASRGAATALKHDDPDTGLEGKFSMQYAVACAAVYDPVGLTAFDDENVSNPTVQRVRERVAFDVDSDLDYGSKQAVVRIETSDETFEHVREYPPGHGKDRFSDRELHDKFMMCAERAMTTADAQVVFDELRDLRDQDSIADVMARLGTRD